MTVTSMPIRFNLNIAFLFGSLILCINACKKIIMTALYVVLGREQALQVEPQNEGMVKISLILIIRQIEKKFL
ncbi:hypothetical protein GCM10028868_19640 [Virgibacillus kimchii]